jgi:hypothetical protein
LKRRAYDASYLLKLDALTIAHLSPVEQQHNVMNVPNEVKLGIRLRHKPMQHLGFSALRSSASAAMPERHLEGIVLPELYVN